MAINWKNVGDKAASFFGIKDQSSITKGDIASGVLGATGNAVSSYISNSQIDDTSAYESQIKDVGNLDMNLDDNDSLMAAYNSFTPYNTNLTREDIMGMSDKQRALNMGLAGFSGMQSGSSAGMWGTIGGAVSGMLGSGLGWLSSSFKAKDKADQLNKEASAANAYFLRAFNNNAGNAKTNTFNKAALNLAAFGGQLDSYTKSRLLTKSFKMKPRKMKYGGFGNYFAYGGDLSGDWTNGVTIINEGGTHEQNPYEGVLVGIDAQGTPNLVEEGEVIFNDYVYSNRLKPTAKQLEDVKLNPKFEGMTFADIAKEVQKESSIRPLDPISKNTLVDSMSKLTAIQEETRAKKAQRQFMREFKAMTPEEQQDTLMQMMPQEEPQQAEMMSEQDAMGILNGRTPRAYQGIREEMPQMEDEEFAFGGNLLGKKYNRFENGSWMYGSNYLNFDNKGMNFNELYADNSDYMKKRKYIIDNWDNQDVQKWINDSYIPYITEYNKSRGYSGNFKVNKDQFIAGTYDNKYGAMHRGLTNFTIPQAAPVETPAAEPPVPPRNKGKRYFIRTVDDEGNVTVKPMDESEIPYEGIKNGNYWRDTEAGKKYSIYGTDTVAEGDTDYEDTYYQLKPKEPKVKSSKYPNSNFLQFAPILGSLMGLFGNEPNYSNADLIAKGRRGIRDVRARAIGNYLQYNPYDVNFERNRLESIGLGTQRSILDSASGNRGAAMASLLALNGNIAGQTGDLYRKAMEFNDNQRKTVEDFNRGTDVYNAQFGMQADQINSGLDTQRANLYAQEANMRDNIESAASQSKSQNITNLFDNLGNLGRSIYTDQQMKWLLEQGYIPNVKAACGGKVKRKKKGLLR